MRFALRRTPHLPLVLILFVYFAAGILYASSAPFLDVSDEVRHYAMIEHFAQGNGLPAQDVALNQQIMTDERAGLRPLTYYAQEASQPPLYYWAMALVALPFDRGDWADRVWPNVHAKLGRADATNNWNQLLHSPATQFPWRDTAPAVMVMRFIGVLLGAATVACTYFIANEMKDERWKMKDHLSSSIFHLAPLLAASLVAFNPMFVHIMASVNNDTLAVALSSLALLIGARMIRRGGTARQALVLGVVLGGAALTKASGLALALVVPFFVLVSDFFHRGGASRDPRSDSRNGKRDQWDRGEGRRNESIIARLRTLAPLLLCILAPLALIAGWWYLRNLALYGDLTGTTMMAAIAGAREMLPSAAELIGEWDGFFKAYWGLFGAVNIPMHEPVYIALEIMLVLAGFGLLLVVGDWLKEIRDWRLRDQSLISHLPSHISNSRTLIALMLFSAFAVAFVALIRWTSLTLASQGRLLFPVIAPISIFTAIGLSRIAYSVSPPPMGGKRIAYPRATRYVILIIPVALAALTLLAPFVYIRPAYALPQVIATDGPLVTGITPTELYFEDKIRWVGFRVNNPGQRVKPGDELDVTLYWQALQPFDKNYSAFIKVYGKGDVPVHELDTYPGGGMFQTTLWQPGDLIADRYRLRIEDNMTNTQLMPTALRLDVGFYDFTTKQELTTLDGSGSPTGRQRYEAAGMNVPPPTPSFSVAERFEKVTLTGVRAEQDGDRIVLTLDWLASDDFTQDYTTFVQLFDASGAQLAPQGDGRALGGDFSPRWWRAGDLILNDAYAIALPPDVAPGNYTLKFGLYAKDGTRMPAFDAAGQPINDAALPVPITIE
jgi:hypothetical protein